MDALDLGEEHALHTVLTHYRPEVDLVMRLVVVLGCLVVVRSSGRSGGPSSFLVNTQSPSAKWEIINSRFEDGLLEINILCLRNS